MPSLFSRVLKRLNEPAWSSNPPQGSNSVRANRFTSQGFGVFANEKGIARASEIGASDPLAIYRSGASKPIPADKAMAANTGWVYCAVNAIASEMSGMEFQIYQVQPDGTPQELQEHDLLDLLDGVNEFQTGSELKHMVVSHLELTGNCYLLLGGVKNATDRPTSIFTLDPSGVKTIYDKSDYPWTIVGYEFTVQGKKYHYKTYEIVQIKYPDPSDPYSGIGTVQCIAPWIDLHNYALEFNRQYFIHGIQFGQMFESDATDDATIDRLNSSLEAGHEGVENAHRATIFPKGVKSLGSGKAKDADYSSLFDLTRDMILAGFRVGKTILGTAESDTNRSTAETADYVFAKRTIKPKMSLIVAALNEYLTPRYGDDLYIGFLDPTPEDKNFRILEMQAVMGNQPVLSVNETREKFQGMGGIEGGDTVKISNTFVDLGAPETDEHPGADNVQGRSAKPAKRRVKTRHAKNAEFRRKLSASIADTVAEKLRTVQSKRVTELTHDEYDVLIKALSEKTSKYEDAVASAVREQNAVQREQVLANLAKLFKKSKKIKLPELFDAGVAASAMRAAVLPTLVTLAAEQVRPAAELIGSATVAPETISALAKAIDEGVQLMAESYEQTTLDQLKEKIAEGIEAGDGYAATAEVVGQIYDFADEVRAQMVAKTETNRAFNAANRATWQSLGVKTLTWHTSSQDNVCPFCASLDGKEVSSDQNFFDRGETLTLDSGQSMALGYSDVSAPPIHPSCNCFVRPGSIS